MTPASPTTSPGRTDKIDGLELACAACISEFDQRLRRQHSGLFAFAVVVRAAFATHHQLVQLLRRDAVSGERFDGPPVAKYE